MPAPPRHARGSAHLSGEAIAAERGLFVARTGGLRGRGAPRRVKPIKKSTETVEEERSANDEQLMAAAAAYRRHLGHGASRRGALPSDELAAEA